MIDPEKYDIRVSASSWDRLLFRLEHWLLSPGRSDTGRLRGYLRVKQWRDGRSARERFHAIKVAAKLPARALRGSWHAVGEHGDSVVRDAGVSRLRQLLHLWWIWMRHGVHPGVYYAFQLYRPGHLTRAPHFLQEYEDDEILRLLNVREALGEAELMLDKVRFEQWLAERRLPTARTLLVVQDGEVVRSNLPGGSLPRCDLFSKPNDSLQGRGAERWVFDGTGWIGPSGTWTEDELIARLVESSRTEGGILLQAKLTNHPTLSSMAPAALGTVRVLTLRGLDGAVRPQFAVCKIPTGDAPTDHMRVGGVAAPVDLESGRLSRAVGKSGKAHAAPVERHPDTGAPIEGVRLPYWEDVVALAVRAHEALDRLVCIGWDIAILEDGPVIIEGNDNPGHTSVQVPTGVALGETPVVSTLLAHLRESFSGTRPVTPRDHERSPSAYTMDPTLPLDPV